MNGGRVTSGIGSVRASASDRIAVTSSARPMTGRAVVARCARPAGVRPRPGRLRSSRWWPPAAQISAARRACGCPATSARSRSATSARIACSARSTGCGRPTPGSVAWTAASSGPVPLSQSASTARLAGATTLRPAVLRVTQRAARRCRTRFPPDQPCSASGNPQVRASCPAQATGRLVFRFRRWPRRDPQRSDRDAASSCRLSPQERAGNPR
jgi:hypothetical protein